MVIELSQLVNMRLVSIRLMAMRLIAIRLIVMRLGRIEKYLNLKIV